MIYLKLFESFNNDYYEEIDVLSFNSFTNVYDYLDYLENRFEDRIVSFTDNEVNKIQNHITKLSKKGYKVYRTDQHQTSTSTFDERSISINARKDSNTSFGIRVYFDEDLLIFKLDDDWYYVRHGISLTNSKFEYYR